MTKIPFFRNFQLLAEGGHASPQQEAILLNRMYKLKNKGELIYRGDTRSRVLAQFNLNQNNFPELFSQYLFMIGSKGRAFGDSLNRNIGNRKHYEIDNVTEEFFIDIFDWINTLLENNSKDSSITDFNQHYPLVKNFFCNNNRKLFIEKIFPLSDKRKIKVRDYYLTLLHHAEDSAYYPGSMLLSVTKDFDVACRFSKKARSLSDDIILFSWAPRHSGKLFNYLSFEKYLKDLELPVYGHSIYPSERELTLKGGLLPHFLLGFLYTENDTQYFNINPAIFSTSDNEENWITDGLPIDQTDFWPMLNDTRLLGGYYVDAGGNYQERLLK